MKCEPSAWSQEHSSRKLKGLSLKKETIGNESTPRPVVVQAIPRRLPKKRGPASLNAGSRTLKNPCPYYFYPNPLEPAAGNLKAGTKIWLEGLDSQWMRGFIRRKSIYIPVKCLEQESETTTADEEGQ
ncbi:MAG: hypothetical protein IPJ71_14335 [Bdellovibrionales bacterium]|nr:hypothetical protein [Bdellovibrionales bacterium]